jgi:GH15 family glucan-1,4-alpha-glucosidase
MEWVIDHLWAAIGFLRAGFVDEARMLFENNLVNAIGYDGRTIESSRWFGYDYTELNQNGSLVHSLWEYLCWTGDFELARKHWDKIKLCAEFPLQDVFFDKRARMVHNKREFWERSDPHGIEDGFEMAYQFWIIMGLEKGAEIADVLNDKATARKWRAKAAEMKDSFLNDPTFKMIEDGRLIKRRRKNGEWQRLSTPPNRGTMPPGSPLSIDQKNELDPDTVTMFPIIFGLVDAKSELGRRTLEAVDTLWGQQWEGGGYPRYNAHSEPDPPAAWPFNSVMVARAHAEAGNDDKVWRVLDWLTNLPTGKSGSWFEHLGSSITPPAPPVGIVGWVWYEIMALYTQQIAGFRPELDGLVVKPHLLRGLDDIHATFIVRKIPVTLHVHRLQGESTASVNGKTVAVKDGAMKIPYPAKGRLTIDFIVPG